MVKPFADPTHTQFSNDALDYILPVCSPACWKLLSAIIRKTKGWHKDEDELSYSQLEALTGMTRPTVAGAVKEALSAGYVKRTKSGISFKYSLNKEFELDTSKEIEPVKKSNQTSKETLPEPVKKSNTQKKERKIKEKELAPNGAPPAEPPKPKISNEVRKFAETVFREATGLEPLPGDNSARWWKPLLTICEVAQGDQEKVRALIQGAVKDLGMEYISAPQSILNTIPKIKAKLNGHSANSHQYREVYK